MTQIWLDYLLEKQNILIFISKHFDKELEFFMDDEAHLFQHALGKGVFGK